MADVTKIASCKENECQFHTTGNSCSLEEVSLDSDCQCESYVEVVEGAVENDSQPEESSTE